MEHTKVKFHEENSASGMLVVRLCIKQVFEYSTPLSGDELLDDTDDSEHETDFG